MRNWERHISERGRFGWLANGIVEAHLTDEQREWRRLETFRHFFQRGVSEKRKRALEDFGVLLGRDIIKIRAALFKENLVDKPDKDAFSNRQMRRAYGSRQYSHGLGRMDVPKSRRRHK